MFFRKMLRRASILLPALIIYFIVGNPSVGVYASDGPDGYLEQGQNSMKNGDYKTGVQNLAMAVQNCTTADAKKEYRTKTLEIIRKMTDALFEKEAPESGYPGVHKIVEAALKYDCFKDSEMLYNQRGSILRKTGKFTQAVVEFRNALNINTDYDPSRFNLALCYFKMKKFKSSYEELDKIPDSSPLYETANKKKNLLMKYYAQLINR
jgi:tetratricopeptide (TPR) repeat protein